MKTSPKEKRTREKLIDPALKKAGWDFEKQVGMEVKLTDGKILVNGTLTRREDARYADYVLYFKPNIPIAIIEAKEENQSARKGLQQALDYASMLDVPFVFSTNGKSFIFHDKTVADGEIETELSMDEFPSPKELWEKYKIYHGITEEKQVKVIEQDFYFDGSDRKPRYYQQVAINKVIREIAKGKNRLLLVMATGTGKTYTAFQIAYRLWKNGSKKKILFLADRTALIDQTRRGDFKHFKDNLTVIKKKVIEQGGKQRLISNKKRGIDSSDKAYEIYLGLYQGLSDADGIEDAYKDFPRDFFDLIIVDECHRGSAKADSAWREILTYFQSATQIGMTATPKETKKISNIEYFGDPVYTYSLKQGINDGFLAPYKVIRLTLNIDKDGWQPPKGYLDKKGKPVKNRIYNLKDFDKNLVVEERRKVVAQKITEYLKGNKQRYAKTILFCVDIEHAEGMTTALINANADICRSNDKYVMQITGDNEEGKRELDNFTNPEEPYPTIVTTSKLLTTGVDAKTCKVIVLDSNIQSMTEFKQIIGRGTRIDEDYDKRYFTILDFRNVTKLFEDEEFDGEPVKIKISTENEDLSDFEEEGSLENDKDSLESEKKNPGLIKAHSSTKSPKPPRPPKKEKVYVNGINVTLLLERNLFFDREGRPITESLVDYTKPIIQKKFKTLKAFLKKWNSVERKTAIIKELEADGVLIEELKKAVDKNVDIFDLICHIAYDMPPLTRRERANNVKKRNYFTKYGETARKVIDALIDKYSDGGFENLESGEVLYLEPFSEYGSPMEIIEEFGGLEDYNKTIKEIENYIYEVA
ncbi:MAG: DEAD/DEAH box helicase family protein [Leptospiraceae bacterium]|nr:DEAD/DEAH box helicase family protein [Leptospiraceae bacterium]MCP5499585.1 DEAD/DEAH box helicase family protein [Leptospiraceae bacterium]